jgi:hypothetical protein
VAHEDVNIARELPIGVLLGERVGTLLGEEQDAALSDPPADELFAAGKGAEEAEEKGCLAHLRPSRPEGDYPRSDVALEYPVGLWRNVRQRLRERSEGKRRRPFRARRIRFVTLYP